MPATMSVRKISVVGGLLTALGPISMSLYTPAMPVLVQVFGTDISTVKLTLTLYFAGFAAAQLICGPLSDAYGRRPVMIAFASLYLLGAVLSAFAPAIGVLLAGRAIQGIGAAAGIAIARAMVRDLYTGHAAAQVMNLLGLMLAVGPAISPTLGGITLDVLGWQAIFALMVIYGLAMVILLLTAVPETLAAPDPRAARLLPLVRRYLILIRDPRFLRPSLVIAGTNGSLYAMATMLPFVLIDVVGLTPTRFGMGMLAQTGSYVVGSLIMRKLLLRVPAHKLVPFGLISIGLGGLLLAVMMRALAPSYLTVMGPAALIAFGLAFTMPSVMTESLAPFPHMAGAAAALAGFMQMGGGLLGSAAAAMIGDPLTAIGTVIPAMVAIAIAAYFALKRFIPPIEEAIADHIIEPDSPGD